MTAAEGGNLFPVVGTARHGTHGNDHNVQQEVPATMTPPRILQAAKVLLDFEGLGMHVFCSVNEATGLFRRESYARCLEKIKQPPIIRVESDAIFLMKTRSFH